MSCGENSAKTAAPAAEQNQWDPRSIGAMGGAPITPYVPLAKQRDGGDTELRQAIVKFREEVRAHERDIMGARIRQLENELQHALTANRELTRLRDSEQAERHELRDLRISNGNLETRNGDLITRNTDLAWRNSNQKELIERLRSDLESQRQLIDELREGLATVSGRLVELSRK
jgi:predicted  nucleic acid-binding Zn-ribbon protein